MAPGMPCPIEEHRRRGQSGKEWHPRTAAAGVHDPDANPVAFSQATVTLRPLHIRGHQALSRLRSVSVWLTSNRYGISVNDQLRRCGERGTSEP